MVALGRALDVVFPRRCAGCGDGPWPFCRGCRSALEPLDPPWCDRCGRPSALQVRRCRDCPPESVTSARAPFHYNGPAKAAIHRLKFSGWRDIASALADAMSVTGLPEVDMVTWVPLARGRLAARGYDQARALAIPLARDLDLPVVRLLRRAVATAPQARRGGPERRTAIRGAFAAFRPAPARVLLVDDVLTTGATAAVCAEVLRAAGALEVHLAVAARSLSRMAPRPATLHDRIDRAYPRAGSRSGLWLPGGAPR